MKRKLLFLALTLAACFTLLPSTALALDYDVFTYDDGDVAVIQTLVENGVLDSAGYPLDGDPWRWEGVGWSGDYDTTQRITSLSLSELTGTLDVSGLDALKTLYCSGNESLTGLIVSGCTSLKTLECSNTGITVLDVSECEALEELRCGSTGITELDVSKCTALDTLDCSGTPITVLDVSGLAELSGLTVSDCTALEELYCRNCTALVSTFFSELASLKTLVVDGCTALLSLDCSNTAITNLDVSECEALEDLDVSECEALEELDVSKLEHLHTLDCSNTGITRLNASKCTALQTFSFLPNASLKTLNVSGCTTLRTLPCTGVSYSLTSLEALDASNCTSLSYINCSGIASLKTLDVTGCTALKELGCSSTGITGLDVSTCDALEGLGCYNTAITELDVTGCEALKTLAVSSCEALETLTVSGCTTLEELSCYETAITELDASRCTALQALDCSPNEFLTSLDVSGCTKLTGVHCSLMGSVTEINVSNCTALTALTCYETAITELDVSTCEALKTLWCYNNNSLKTLNVTGCDALEDLDCHNTGITELNVSGLESLKTLDCSFVYSPVAGITENFLEELNASDCTALETLHCDGCTELTWLYVSNCTALTDMDCSYTAIFELDVSGYDKLENLNCKANVYLEDLILTNCTALKTLDISKTPIRELDASDCAALEELDATSNEYEDGRYLEKLDISGCVKLTDLSCDGEPLLEITVPAGYTVGSRNDYEELHFFLPNPIIRDLYSLEPPIRTHEFNGWYTEPTTGGEKIEEGHYFNEATTIYSQWKYLVYFEAGEGAYPLDYIAYGEKVESPYDPYREGLTFGGWYGAYGVDADTENLFEGDTYKWDFEKDTVEGPFTLYAKWTTGTGEVLPPPADEPDEPENIYYTVIFLSDGKQHAKATVLESYPASAPADPTKSGHIFEGWYDANGNKWNFNTPITGDITLYAKWTEKRFTVTFDSAGGSDVAPQSVIEGEKATKPADPTKVKHAFDGWYDENDSKWNFSTPITEDITLYAKWVEKDYTVNFESEGGSAVAPQYVDGGERLKKPADPTKSGHTFGGWYRDTVFEKVEDNVYTFTVDTENLFNDVYAWSFDTEVVMGDFTLHAKWTQIPYTGGGGGGSSTTPVKPEDKKDEEKKDEEQPVPTVTFSDVPSEAYYADAVAWAVEKGITNGVGEGSFAPEASCTRGQMVTFLWRMAGCPTVSGGASFSDVTTDSYYADAIAWAVSMGITNGTGNGLFSPDAECTRAQMAVFLYRMVGGSVDGASGFADVDEGSYYAYAVAWAVANGITNGTGDGLFSPNMNCTRGQMVTFLFRCFAE